MRSKLSLISIALALFAILVGTTGCSSLAGSAFPDASINPQQVPLGTIQGSDFGGHAPLVGAHVYVLQPATTGYGNQATSLLTATTSGNGYTTSKNTGDPNIPTGSNAWYYETTDATGAFNISGDYTCTAGQPVYLYLYGGSPTYPSASNVFNVNQVVVSGVTGLLGALGTATYTITTTTTQNFYVGEQVVGSNFSPTAFNVLNATLTVLATNLTTTTFAVTTTGTLLELDGTYTTTGTITAEPTFNPAVVNLAVLGNCPNGGTNAGFGNTIHYVYVNEVSTAAAAYAFAPFTLATNNDATHIGTSSTNLAGLTNAALLAGQLYDIQGSSVSTSYAGEGHIARTINTNGNGIVPQATLDTLGNILAACVDSNNTATTLGTTGTPSISPQCTTLFTNATNTAIPTTATGTGVNAPGTQPFDTATAALNIARHPGGPPPASAFSSTAFVNALFTLPQGNVPFTPYLTVQPNDFTVGILYNQANNPGTGNGSYTVGAESLAVDKVGNVWFTTQPGKGNTNSGYLFEMSPLGVISNVNFSSYLYGYVFIDSGQSAWAGSALTANLITYVHATATSNTYPFTTTYAAAVTTHPGSANVYSTYAGFGDASGNVYFTYGSDTGSKTGGGANYLTELAGAATTPTGTFGAGVSLGGLTDGTDGVSHAAVDHYGGVYLDENAAGVLTRAAIANGGIQPNWPVTASTAGCTAINFIEQMAVDNGSNVFVPNYASGSGAAVFYMPVASGNTACSALTNSSTGATFSGPFGAAVDGNNNLWITNRGSNNGTSVVELSNAGASSTAISPATNYIPQYEASGATSLTPMLSGPLNIAVDPSGNVWTTNYGGNAIVEIVGIAAPTVTPLSVAANVGGTSSLIGTKP
jgi:hypothetical protein